MEHLLQASASDQSILENQSNLEREPTPQQTAIASLEVSLMAGDSAATLDASAAHPYAQPSGSSFWKTFSSTFFTIFLAEIGDKTQVSTLLMSAEFHQPWVVFAGAGTALVATTLLGVWVGQWLSSRLSPRTLDVSAGILLALISASLIWDVVMM